MEILSNEIRDLIWGIPLIALLVGTGIYLTFLLKGLQFRKLYHSLWLALVKRKEEKSAKTYRLLFIIMVFVGAVVKLDLVWTFADIMNGLMALPNLTALLGLNGIVAAETRNYFNKAK